MHIRRMFGRLKDQIANSLEALTDGQQPDAEQPAVAEALSETRPAGPPSRVPPPPATPPAARPAPDAGSSPGPLRGVVQSTPDNTAYQLRNEHVQRIDAMFGGYGGCVSSYMLTQSLSDGGVRRVVEKLSLSSRGRDGADLGQICQWIETHGVEEFCRRTNLRLTPLPPPVAAPPSGPGAEGEVRVRMIEPRQRPVPRDGDSSGGEKMATGPRPRRAGPGETQPVNFDGARQKVTVQPVGLDGKDLDRLRRPAPPTEPPSAPPPKGPATPAAGPPSPVPDSDPARGPMRSSAEVYLNQFLDEESGTFPPQDGKKKPG